MSTLVRSSGVLLVATLGACATLQLTTAGRDVPLFSGGYPTLLDNYSELTIVTCERKSLRSVGTNIIECQNELRNRVAELGGHLVIITSQQLGASDCGTCVTIVATAYRKKMASAAAPAP